MIPIEKYHGTGNDFFVVDAAEPVADRRKIATRLCDREDGLAIGGSIGADGVLFLALEDGYASPRVVMTLVQPDGSTAPMCGNGARCAAAWAARRLCRREESERATPASDGGRRGAASDDASDDETTVMVDTQAGTRRATVDGDSVTIEMGAPSFAPAAVPVVRDEPLVEEPVEGLTVTAVNTDVPHAVAFVDDVSTVDLDAVAPAVRHADAFPRGANVTVASPSTDDGPDWSAGAFDQRTYERGVEGETRSCGTGAVAIAAVARELGHTDAEAIAVRPPGGRLDIRLDERGAVLAGPTEREGTAEIQIDNPQSAEAAGD
ncbi:diaminopimelate epimerase [Halococcus sp. PRR34]|uniref:diaminopimelate epimerase n=1 Tax=Halococcus sp. PRR34 TaxID=3020830 RepID=UPI0023614FD6|nr:diaminopimelate epimerase [Halococcus sp. PRR34]